MALAAQRKERKVESDFLFWEIERGGQVWIPLPSPKSQRANLTSIIVLQNPVGKGRRGCPISRIFSRWQGKGLYFNCSQTLEEQEIFRYFRAPKEERISTPQLNVRKKKRTMPLFLTLLISPEKRKRRGENES